MLNRLLLKLEIKWYTRWGLLMVLANRSNERWHTFKINGLYGKPCILRWRGPLYIATMPYKDMPR